MFSTFNICNDPIIESSLNILFPSLAICNQQREIYGLVKRLQYYIALSLDFFIEVYRQ